MTRKRFSSITPRSQRKSASTEPRTARDIELLEGVVNEYWALLVAYASRLLDDVPAAEDVVQRAFVRLWDRSHVLPPDDELRPYLYRIVRNLVHNEWRNSGARDRWMQSEQEAAAHAALAAPAPDAHFDAMELQEALERALRALPPRRREVFVLSRYHGLSNAEIAQLLGVSAQTVANTMVAALKDLKQLLSAHLDSRPAPGLGIVRNG